MNISVMPKEEGGNIPVSLAGRVLIDIQDMLTHIGEYLVMKELKLQNRIDGRLSGMFRLFIDPASGVSLGSSTVSTSGIVDDALALLERTLTGMGSGAGGYWMDDAFSDPRYRRTVTKDVIRLAQDLGDGYYIKFSADSVFDGVDTGRLEEYLEGMQMMTDDATCGVIRGVRSRSGRSDGLRLDVGDERLRMSFLTPDIEEEASGLVDRPAIVAGRIRYSGDRIGDVIDIGKAVPLDSMRFKRIISAEGDVSLTDPVRMDVSFDNGKEEWNLRNDDLGINISKATWDEAMASFHDYFIFLFDTYTSKKDSDLSAEETEIKDLLISLVAMR